MRAEKIIYKISPRTAWEEAEQKGKFEGAPIDLQDGFIHFSAVDQVAETASKHFAGENDLLLVAVDATSLGDTLKWEVSRGGALFPHLYANLSMESVLWVKPMPLSDNGRHQIPTE